MRDMKMNYFNLLMTAAIIFIFFTPQKALAYIDPGTGSMMVQVLIGVLVGALFALKTFWKRIAIFLKDEFSILINKKKEE